MTVVTKQLVGVQDLLLGTQSVEQVRAGAPVPINGLSGESLPHATPGSSSLTSLLVPQVRELEEGRVRFDRAGIYGNPAALTGNISASLADGPVRGVEITIFHNSPTEPLFYMLTPSSVPWVKQGNGEYIPNTDNMIIARFLFGERVDYVIVPALGET